MKIKGSISNGLDLDIYYQDYDSEQHSKSFSRQPLFIKKLLTKKT